MDCNREIPFFAGRRGFVHLGERDKKPSEMGRVGFEPTTNALKGHCSSTELPTQNCLLLYNFYNCIRLGWDLQLDQLE